MAVVYNTSSPYVDDNATLANMSDEDRRRYLDILQEQTTRNMIPAMAFLTVLAVLGVIGNSFVLAVYSRKFKRTSTRILIMAIAGFDLVTNVVVTPGEIYDMHHIWDFDNPPLCRARMFFSAFATVSAAVILLAVAVVRFRKVCRPFGKQVTVRQSKIITVVIATCALTFAVPTAIINGRQTKKTPWPGVHGGECTTDDSFVDTIWPIVNTGVLLLLFVSCCVPLIILYVLIGIQAWKHSTVFGVSSAAKSGTGTSASQSSTSGPFTKSTDDSVSNLDTRKRQVKKANKCGQEDDSDDNLDVDNNDSHGRNIDLKVIEVTNVDDVGKNKPLSRNEQENQRLLKKVSISSQEDMPMDVDTIFSTKMKEVTRADLKPAGIDDAAGRSNNDTVEEKATTEAASYLYKHTVDTAETSLDNRELREKTSTSEQVANERATGTTGEMHLPAAGSRSFKVQLNVAVGSEEKHVKYKKGNNSEIITQVKSDGCCTLQDTSSQQAGFVTETSSDVTRSRNSDQKCKGEVWRSLCRKSGGQKGDNTTFWDKLMKRGNYSVGKTQNNLGAQKKRPKRKAIGRTTFMLIIISAVYILSYVPHLAMMFFKFTSPEQFIAMDAVGLSFYNLFLRFYFLNSAANPIIYSLCDVNFRQQCLRLMHCKQF